MCLNLLNLNARTVFATHFTEIGMLPSSSPDRPQPTLTWALNAGPYLRERKEMMVTCVHFDSKNAPDPYQAVREVNISHRLVPGPIVYQDYGIDLARRFLPHTVVNFAEQVSDFLRGTTQSQAPLPGPDTPSTMRRRLIIGVLEILTQLQDAATGGPSAALARELQSLQITAREMEEGMAGPATTPPSAPIDAPASAPTRPMPSFGLRSLLSGPQTGPTAEQRERWALEEHRVMAANTRVWPGNKRPKEEEKDISAGEFERPPKVSRGRAARSSRDVSPEPEELTRELDRARKRLREWEREDSI